MERASILHLAGLLKHRPGRQQLAVGKGQQIAKLQHHMFALGWPQKHIVIHGQIHFGRRGDGALVGALVGATVGGDGMPLA